MCLCCNSTFDRLNLNNSFCYNYTFLDVHCSILHCAYGLVGLDKVHPVRFRKRTYLPDLPGSVATNGAGNGPNPC